MTKQCEWCKKEFESKERKAKFCSRDCTYESQRLPIAMSHCEKCGNEFRSKKSRYAKNCSRLCAAKLGAPQDRACAWCGNSFVATFASQILCSAECKRMRKQKIRIDKLRAVTDPQRNKRCLHCGKSFYAKRLDKVWCSKSCSNMGAERKNPSRASNAKRIKAKCYDEKLCLETKTKYEEMMTRIRRDPVALARYRQQKRETQKRCALRKKKEVARAAYLADPINAARIEAANLSRMTPEERDRWLDKQEQEREKQERKAKREALKKEIAAQSVTASTVKKQFGEAFNLEWAPQ